MGLLTQIALLPLAPARAVVALADQVLQQAEQTYYDPATIRRELDQVDQLRREGQLTDEEADEWEQALIDRLTEGRGDRG